MRNALRRGEAASKRASSARAIGGDETFVHVTSGESAGGVVRQTLRRLKRRERILAMRDPMNVGPLEDVDDGARQRLDWWTRVLGKRVSRADAERLDEGPRLRELVEDGSKVVIWHGPEPSERLLLLRVCWYFRGAADRLFEVTFPPPVSRKRPTFHAAVGATPVDTAAARWEQRTAVRDVAGHASEWERLRSTAGDHFRIHEGDRVVETPVTALDDVLVGACRAEWSSPWAIIGRVVWDHPVGDLVLAWRLRELVRIGRIAGRGRGKHPGLPAEVRRPSTEG